MAGDVEIRGGGDLDGAVLRNAATESTLRELVTALNSKSKGSGSKVLEMHEKVVKDNIVATEKSSNSQAVFDRTLGSLNKTSEKLGQKFTEIAGMAVGGIFSGITTAGRMLLGFFTDSLDSFRQTSSVGASFNNDLVQLRRTAAESAMPLEMFTQTITQNSQVLAAFGGTVTQGAQRFATLSKELRTGDIGQRLMGMGLTMQDINEQLVDYMSIQSRMGRLQGQTDAQLREGTIAYTMEMDKLTKITGLSRKQQADGLRAAMRDGRVLQLQSRLSGESLNRFNSAVTVMQNNLDPQMMGSVTNMMSGIIDPADSFAKMLVNTVPGVMEFNRAMGQGQLTTEQVVEGARAQIAAIDRQLAGMSDEEISKRQDLQQMRQYQASLRALAAANTGAAAEEQRNRNTITETLGSFSQTIEKIKNDILLKLINSRVFERVQNALKAIGDIIMRNSDAFGNALSGFVDSVLKFVENIEKIGIGPAISQLFSDLFKDLPSISSVVFDLGKSAIKGMFDLLVENWGATLVGLVSVIAAVVLGGITGPISLLFIGLGTGLAAVFGWDAVKGWTEGGWEAIKDLGTNIANIFSWDSISGFFTDAWDKIMLVPRSIMNIFSGTGTLTDLFKSAMDAIFFIPNTILSLFNLPSVTEMYSNIWNIITGIPNKIMEFFSLENLNLPKMSDLFNGLINTVRGFFNFDFQLPNIRDFLPSWLGGTGRNVAAGQAQRPAAPDRAQVDVARVTAGANARLRNAPDTTNTGNELDLDYVTYPETGRPPASLTAGLSNEQIARLISPESTARNINIDTLATELTSANREIRSGLEMLAQQINNLNTNNTGNIERLQNLNNLVGVISMRMDTATNTMVDEQKKLNTLITELKPIFESTRDSTKDVADATSGRRSAL